MEREQILSHISLAVSKILPRAYLSARLNLAFHVQRFTKFNASREGKKIEYNYRLRLAASLPAAIFRQTDWLAERKSENVIHFKGQTVKMGLKKF